jgi:DNA-binding transcriptional regulator YbjK
MRGLTHRAVDQTAGLPEGSTSYYFRTRQALLQAVVERLTELTADELPTLSSADLGEFTVRSSRLIQQWLTSGRERQLARYELTLEATRRPELRRALDTSGAGIRFRVADLLRSAGVAEPEAKAHEFTAYLDGLLFDQIMTDSRRLDTEQLTDAIRTLVTAVTA